MNNIFIFRRIIILIITCYFFFFLGNSVIALTDPDEVFYSLTAKEMAVNKQWLVPFIFDKPQFEKPIFTFWLLRIAFDAWGDTPFSARFFPALFACFGVLGVYAIGYIGFRNERKAFYSALVLCSAGLYTGMARTVFTDMFFTVFMLLTMLSFYIAFTFERYKKHGILLFFIFIALGVLTKGPLAFSMAEMTIILFLLYIKRLDFLKTKWFPVGVILCLILALPWYIYIYQHYGKDFIQEFFYNDHYVRLIKAEHKGNDHWYFYPLTILLGFFPWTLFTGMAFVEIYKKLRSGLQNFEYFLISWIVIVFITFQFAHSKLASYIMPMFPAVALLTGSLISDMIDKRYKFNKAKIFIVIFSIFLIILGCLVLITHPLYKVYVPDAVPTYFLSATLLSLGVVSLILILKDQTFRSMIIIGCTPVILLWALFFLKAEIQPYVSTYDASMYIPYVPPGKTLLASKPYARGLRYFTNNKVTVLNINGGNYFSPHPIKILTNEEEAVSFLRSQVVTYAVLKNSGYKTLVNLCGKNFNITVLKKIGYNYVLKVEAIK